MGKAASLSQEQLAERVNINPSFLAHLESGSKKPSLDTLLGIAEALDAPPALLLPGAEALDAMHVEFARSVRGLGPDELTFVAELARRLRRRRARPQRAR